MITIHELPALRLLLAFVTGIIIAPYFTHLSPLYIASIIGLALISGVLLSLIHIRYKIRYLFTLMQFIPGIGVSVVLITFLDQTRNPEHLVNQTFINDSTEVELIAELTDPVSHKKNYQIPISVDGIKYRGQDHFQTVSGKVVLFCKTLDVTLLPGDKLHIRTILKDPAKNINANAFDYRAFLARKGVFKTGWVNSEDVMIIEKASAFNLKNITLRIRDQLLERTKVLLGDNEEADLSAGILFGYREKIDESTEDQFVNAGAVHLLAVSGMHVILIYTNIRWFLRLLRLHKLLSDKWISFISIILIWTFSFLVGLAPSIVRATIMLSLLILGDIINKKGNSFNIVSAGALIMLVYDPMTLYDVGFQLSFAAVIGIIQLQKACRNILPAIFHRSKTLVDLISVTLAAQIGTLPLILFYFHQFPVYFLLTGIIAVLISDWIIKIGGALLILSAVSLALAQYFSLLWFGAARALLISIDRINKLPNVLIDNIYFDLPMAITTSIMILLLIIHKISRIKYFGPIILSCFLLLISLDFRAILINKGNERVTVYYHNKLRVVEIQNGLNSMVIMDDEMKDKSLKNIISGNQLSNGVKNSEIVRLNSSESAGFIFKDSTYVVAAIVER